MTMMMVMMTMSDNGFSGNYDHVDEDYDDNDGS